MKQSEVFTGPWFSFPCMCSHGCGPFFTLEQIMGTPCQGGHHDFRFPQKGMSA